TAGDLTVAGGTHLRLGRPQVTPAPPPAARLSSQPTTRIPSSSDSAPRVKPSLSRTPCDAGASPPSARVVARTTLTRGSVNARSVSALANSVAYPAPRRDGTIAYPISTAPSASGAPL